MAYTSHGHHISGTIKDDSIPAQVARCGGPGLCSVCSRETVVAQAKQRIDLEEVDRNARAYGWEVGRGHKLTADIKQTSPDNPFRHSNWRDFIEEPNED